MGEDGQQIDDPLDDLLDEVALPDHLEASDVRREAQIAQAMAILNS